MSTPPQPEFRSEQYEFSAEHNRALNELAANMGTVATLLKLAGVVFLLFLALLLIPAIRTGELPLREYGPIIGLGAGMLLCLSIGFWTSSAARSFRKIVESKNQDVWHLMNALGRLRDLYSLLRTLIMGGILVLVIGLALYGYDRFVKGEG